MKIVLFVWHNLHLTNMGEKQIKYRGVKFWTGTPLKPRLPHTSTVSKNISSDLIASHSEE